jgi:serine/threonine protein kinase
MKRARFSRKPRKSRKPRSSLKRLKSGKRLKRLIRLKGGRKSLKRLKGGANSLKLLKSLRSGANNLETFTFSKKLGKGQFGEVYLEEYNGKKVAVKKCPDTSIHGVCGEKLIKEEAEIIRKLGEHNNIVKLIAVSEFLHLFRNFDVMITELCEYGSLLSQLEKREKIKVVAKAIVVEGSILYRVNKADQERLNLCVALDIANGIKHLSDKHIVHRDIRAANILLATSEKRAEYNITYNFRAKIGDFGLSREMTERDGNFCFKDTDSSLIPFRWVAPEVFDSNTFTTSSDIWSLGIVLIETYTNGKIPYHLLNNTHFNELINNNKIIVKIKKIVESLFNCHSKKVETLLNNLFKESSKRITIDELIKSITQILTNLNISSIPVVGVEGVTEQEIEQNPPFEPFNPTYYKLPEQKVSALVSNVEYQGEEEDDDIYCSISSSTINCGSPN